MKNLSRNLFLFLSKNKVATSFAKKYGLRFGASRFVAGETLELAVNKIRELNSKGLTVTIDFLGEFVDNESDANYMADNSIEAIKAIGKEGLNATLSLKMTSMGMDISDSVLMNNMKRILQSAKENNVIVTIDMEDYSRCQKTIDVLRELRKEFDNVGTVLQAYLYRTQEDIQSLNDIHPHLRLVKGAYKESPEVAFPDKKDVDENLKKMIKTHLLNGNFTAIASHDEEIINFTKNFVKEYSIPSNQFEFQMLYGICTELQEQLVKEGYNMRVYVPYGTDWYGYFMRRLAERPANVWFVLKNLNK